MNHKYIEGKTYESVTHGPVIFRGIDNWIWQNSLMFESAEHGMQYWLPESLHFHFKSEQIKSV